MESPQTILFFGHSGSGKGTQAKKLIEFLDNNTDSKSVYIETGARIREFITKEGYTNKVTKDIIDSGGLLPEFLPIWIWSDVLVHEYTGKEHLILDGLSRRLQESRVLHTTFQFYGINKPKVVCIEVSREWSRQRLTERGRPNDDAEKIEERIDWYEENTQPAIDFFKAQEEYEFITVNGEQSIDEVHTEVLEKLGLNGGN